MDTVFILWAFCKDIKFRSCDKPWGIISLIYITLMPIYKHRYFTTLGISLRLCFKLLYSKQVLVSTYFQFRPYSFSKGILKGCSLCHVSNLGGACPPPPPSSQPFSQKKMLYELSPLSASLMNDCLSTYHQ